METGKERLLRVIGDVGSDLIATAEQKVFAKSPWRTWLPVAACAALVLGMGYYALPYLTVREEASPAEPPQSVEAVIDTESDKNSPPVNGSMASGETALTSEKEQLVFWDTVYYVEAVYEAETAIALTDGYLGNVTAADDESLIGAEVFLRRDAATKTDYKEREVPLEILVFNGEDYLYCLTYYEMTGPLLEWMAVQSRWYSGKLDALAETFAVAAAPDFETAADLNQDELLRFFLLTLELERAAGRRTADLDRYLWYNGEQYTISYGDVARQLDKYLDDHQALPENLTVELPTLELEREDWSIVPEQCRLDEEGKTLTLVLQKENVKKRCVIRFEDDRCVFQQIQTITE